MRMNKVKKSNLPKVKDIKIYRIKSRLTQKQLAIESGVSVSMINQVESGRTMPSYSTAVKIFEACGFEENSNAVKVKRQGDDLVRCEMFIENIISNLQSIKNLLGSKDYENKNDIKKKLRAFIILADKAT
jgi:transcriptional regulator with XRE-family HTH domain